MVLEIKTKDDNRIDYIKYNGKNFGNGITEMNINIDGGIVDIRANASEFGEKFIIDELFNEKCITFYKELSEKEPFNKEEFEEAFRKESEEE